MGPARQTTVRHSFKRSIEILVCERYRLTGRNAHLTVFDHRNCTSLLGRIDKVDHDRNQTPQAMLISLGMNMMLEFDNSTLANMTAALDHGCKMLSGDIDTSENRKRIGDAIIGAAKSHKRTLVQLSAVAEQEAGAILGQSRPSFVDSILKRLKPAL